MPFVRARLPAWTHHPVFGAALLLALAGALIVHGEPQPSSRPSGRSVVVTSAPPSNTTLPATLLITGGTVQQRGADQSRRVALPPGARPVSVITAHGYSVVLAVRNGLQRAYGVTAALKVTDLGLADNAVPAATPGAAVVIERAVTDPGSVTGAQPSGSREPSFAPRVAESRDGPTPGVNVPTRSPTSSAAAGSAPARDYTVRRYDSLGRPIGSAVALPEAERIATDSAIGLIAWKPVNLVLDRGQVSESLSATATLIRPDGSLRVIGAFHPLAASPTELLVWDVAHGAFGLVPLAGATASASRAATPSSTASVTATSTSKAAGNVASPKGSSASPSAPVGVADTSGPSVSTSPTSASGARFFQPTRGFVVTGPSSFSPDGKSFAAYAQVGTRRRLVIGDVADVGTDQIEVLALSQGEAEPRPSGAGSVNSTAGVPVSGIVTAVGPPTALASSGAQPGEVTGSVTRPSSSASTSSAPAIPTLGPDGFPAPAPAEPVWLAKLVVGVSADGRVIGYVPGGAYASVLDLGASSGVASLAAAP